MPSKAAIDTNFFVAALAEASTGKYTEICQKVISTVAEGYECIISLIVPGEYLSTIKEIAGNDKGRFEGLLSYFKRWLLKGKFQIFKMEDRNIWQIFNDLKFLRGHHDRMIVACAIGAKCEILFTTDDEIYEQRGQIAKISFQHNGYRINIGHPIDKNFKKKFG